MATILRMAAEAMSSPLGCPTRVIPRYLTLNTMPSSRVSLVSVQFSGSSASTTRQDTESYRQINTGVCAINTRDLDVKFASLIKSPELP